VLVDLELHKVVAHHFDGQESLRIFDMVKKAVPGVLIAVDDGDSVRHRLDRHRPAGVEQGDRADRALQRLDVHLDEVAAIGDHFNDLPMLKIVGLPVAMGNAIPAVLEVVDRVMPSNEDDGVAVLINEILSGR
jgi:hydroxymethylpyrimidine pyrophosphatase-like HAD family hydrolase